METSSLSPLDLRSLRAGMVGLTPPVGGAIAEAAAICLEHNAHAQGVELPVSGVHAACFELDWEPATDQARRCHADMQDATENGACGVAIALSKELLNKEVVEKSWKGRGKGHGFGFDYWLGVVESEEPLVFLKDTRLEVSGILRGSDSDLKTRLRQKIDQVARYEEFPGVAIVVGFGSPKALIGQP